MLSAMPTRRNAFSLVEVLVALTLVSVAAAGLAVVLSGDRRLRDFAAAHDEVARRARERLEWLAIRPCLADTGGVSAGRWGSEQWRATVAANRWTLVDSVLPLRVTRAIGIHATIACPVP